MRIVGLSEFSDRGAVITCDLMEASGMINSLNLRNCSDGRGPCYRKGDKESGTFIHAAVHIDCPPEKLDKVMRK